MSHTLRIVESRNDIPEHFPIQVLDRKKDMTDNALGISSTLQSGIKCIGDRFAKSRFYIFVFLGVAS
ncbi:hypothetical protein LEP1GSC187_1072 [Leptospira santarosai str. ZUN179]|uniref:Uncharacterized protein n=1 Tax=Leptospira santarosai str. ZUN179 TaxID=1049985 RepID=M6V1Q4_9LEPT|nr:hypothetical protein LEP1GSC187_1072 [Leptospira santarosai str. ZUN179]